MHIGSVPESSSLDRGDGVCKFFVDETKLCSIYERRPIVCNVDKAYNTYFKSDISLEDYYKINYESCKILKEKYGS